MSLILQSGRRRTFYPLPRSVTAAPWNGSDAPCTIPTYDGSGQTIHPSVVDMGSRWHGYRWWMANTPYPHGDATLEDPSILASNDRINWHVPVGLTNPIDPYPGSGYHSDTELVYDPEAGHLVCFYRYTESGTQATTLHAKTSTDGVTWVDQGVLMSTTYPCPSVVRIGAGDWRLYYFNLSSGAPYYSATNPLGPWTFVGVANAVGWHGDFMLDPSDGRWYAAFSRTSSSGDLRLVSSLDGITWTNYVVAITPGPQPGVTWAESGVYRPTLLLSTEAGFIDCWYSCPTPEQVDYVRLPKSLWPVP